MCQYFSKFTQVLHCSTRELRYTRLYVWLSKHILLVTYEEKRVETGKDLKNLARPGGWLRRRLNTQGDFGSFGLGWKAGLTAQIKALVGNLQGLF